MKWALTTVSYRYHLYSFDELVTMARACGFRCIELWEPHLKHNQYGILSHINNDQALSLPIEVLSAYQDLTDLTDLQWQEKLERKMISCRQISTHTLRLFSGQLSSFDADEDDWKVWFKRLDYLESLSAKYKIKIVFETHPGTLLDSVQGVERLIEQIKLKGWENIRINFDVFHVWEFGIDPVEALQKWYPFIGHVHLKNASKKTEQFTFTNVYHPMGCFDELTSLFRGVVDIEPVITWLAQHKYDKTLTLEWFGLPDVKFFREELNHLNEIVKSEKELYV
jgi:3-dehydroshikimate dehydratase